MQPKLRSINTTLHDTLCPKILDNLLPLQVIIRYQAWDNESRSVGVKENSKGLVNSCQFTGCCWYWALGTCLKDTLATLPRLAIAKILTAERVLLMLGIRNVSQRLLFALRCATLLRRLAIANISLNLPSRTLFRAEYQIAEETSYSPLICKSNKPVQSSKVRVLINEQYRWLSKINFTPKVWTFSILGSDLLFGNV